MRSPERRTQTRFLFRFAFPTAATAADKSSVRVCARDSDVTFCNIDFCDIAEILSKQGWVNNGFETFKVAPRTVLLSRHLFIQLDHVSVESPKKEKSREDTHYHSEIHTDFYKQ